MNPLYMSLLHMGLAFLRQYLQAANSHSLPAEVIEGINVTIAALEKHKDDVINKANLDALLG